jgi:stage II sporulation protein AA (anti-sigma F factor antagonist)
MPQDKIQILFPYQTRGRKVDIQTRQTGNVTVASAAGKIDAMTAPALETSLADLIKAGQLSLVLDFGGVDYISSAGLRVILATAKSLKSRDGALLLANARGPVKEVFDIAGFGAVFDIYDSVEAAVKALG